MYTKQQLTVSRFFLVFVAGLAAIGPMGIDAYLPTLPNLASDFGVDMAAANLTVSTFMMGMALGQFLGGPLSDQLGRKTVGLVGLLIFIVASSLIAVATNIEQVLALRLIQAVGGGFASVICMAQVRDVYEPKEVGKKFANIILVILIAPMFAPAIGTVISVFGWRAIFVALAIFTSAMALIYLIRIPETNLSTPEKFSFKQIFIGYWAAINNRTNGNLVAVRYALFTGFSAGILFCYVTNAAFILIDHFDQSKFQFSAYFGVMVFALMIGNRLTARLMNTRDLPSIIYWANLLQLIAAATMVTVCLTTVPSLWQVMLGIGVLMACNGAISPASGGHFISLFDKNIGAASSLNSTLMFAFGSLIGGLASVLANGELLPIFATMLGSSLIARMLLLSAQAKERQ
ncbi:MAG: DHA1 family bicyclomycin/chloramphenicol resistance-like MFS transporter [Arenicella sp.]|jgi:DHA1 family bicyclomycin/chloramphenicol resistance-like MFS transporter